MRDPYEHVFKSIDRKLYALDTMLASINAHPQHAQMGVYEERVFGPMSGDHLTKAGSDYDH